MRQPAQPGSAAQRAGRSRGRGSGAARVRRRGARRGSRRGTARSLRWTVDALLLAVSAAFSAATAPPLGLAQQLLRIVRACRRVGWRRPYRVVPVSMELVTMQVSGFERLHLPVRDLDAPR